MEEVRRRASADAADSRLAQPLGADLTREGIHDNGPGGARVKDEPGLPAVHRRVDQNTWERILRQLDRCGPVAEGPRCRLLGRTEVVGRDGRIRFNLAVRVHAFRVIVTPGRHEAFPADFRVADAVVDKLIFAVGIDDDALVRAGLRIDVDFHREADLGGQPDHGRIGTVDRRVFDDRRRQVPAELAPQHVDVVKVACDLADRTNGETVDVGRPKDGPGEPVIVLKSVRIDGPRAVREAVTEIFELAPLLAVPDDGAALTQRLDDTVPSVPADVGLMLGDQRDGGGVGRRGGRGSAGHGQKRKGDRSKSRGAKHPVDHVARLGAKPLPKPALRGRVGPTAPSQGLGGFWIIDVRSALRSVSNGTRLGSSAVERGTHKP